MKLARYGKIGQEKPAIIDTNGEARDLSTIIPDITPSILSEVMLDQLRLVNINSLPIIEKPFRYSYPVNGIRKFLAIGLNYLEHAHETKQSIPTEPIVFTKAISCIQGPNDAVMLPLNSQKTDWEVELGVFIGRTARYISPEQAYDYIAGYCVINDVSERNFQIERTSQWDKGKGCDTFGPIGPWLVTKEEIRDIQNLNMWLEVNGKYMQRGTTNTMIFSVPYIVSHISHFMTLTPGDLITTGTPSGVGMSMNPPKFLRSGDILKLGIDGLGEQRQVVYDFAY